MRFVVKKEIFEELPSACFGVVMAKGIDNNNAYPEIEQFLDESIQAAMQRFEGRKVKEDPDILPYREAFRALNINPNKYFCSIEALFTRIAKGKGVPHINPVVDLGNAISLKYTLPMGAHDLGKSSEDICIRLARPDDTFLAFGGEKDETPDLDEVVYAIGQQVRTRRWTWRQSENGKITSASTDSVPAAGLGGKAKTEKSLPLPQTYSFPLMVLQISIASVYLLRRMNSRCE